MGAALPALRNINLSDLAFGYRSGLLLTQPWKNRLIFDNARVRRPMNGAMEAMQASLPILLTLRKTQRLGCIENSLKTYNGTFTAAAYILIALNSAAGKVCHKKLSQVHGKKDKFLWVVWKATPYLLMITNVALIIIEMRTHQTKAITALAIMGVSLLELTSLMPQSFDWYLSVGIRMPVDVVALYYASNMNRFRIIVDWAFIPAVNTRLKEISSVFLNQVRRIL